MNRIATAALALVLIGCDNASGPAGPAARPDLTGVNLANVVNESFDVTGFFTYNACSPAEAVLITKGALHYNISATANDNGFHYSGHVNAQGIQGEGLTSGLKYQVGLNQKVQFNILANGAANVEQSLDFRVNSQGSTDNMTLTFLFKATVNSNGELTNIRFEPLTIECKG